jgi:hypothetical protein
LGALPAVCLPAMEARQALVAASPTPDHFQEAVAVLKSAMQAEQQFKRGATEQGAEAAALYDQGLGLLDLAIRSDRHVNIREQLQEKSADVRKKVRVLLRRVDAADVEAARARLAGELTAGQGLGLQEAVEAWVDTSTPAAAPAPGAALGLTPANGAAADTYATPTGELDDQSVGTPRTVQRSVALQQATAARHGLFDSAASPQAAVASGATTAEAEEARAKAEARAQAEARRAAAAEQRALASDEARRRAEEALRQAQLRGQAAESRAEQAERELAAAKEAHAAEVEQRLSSENSRFEVRLAEAVAAARQHGREEGIALSPRGRVGQDAAAAAPSLPSRPYGASGGVTTLSGAYGVGPGEWKADLLRRKLAAAQAYVVQLEQQLGSVEEPSAG